MINNVVLAGRLTKDPDIRETGSGHKVANFTLAVNRKFKGEDGEYQADFINCQVWRQQAENLEKYVNKGDLVAVEGRIQTRSYENDEGRTVYITEIVAQSVTYLETNREKKAYDTKDKKPSDFEEKKIDKVKQDNRDIDDLPF